MDCRTCKHNTYRDSNVGWVCCSHPTTITKSPKWEKGDPAWVDMMTADMPISRIGEIRECPAYEALTLEQPQNQ